jgi:hypothetical protein
VKAARSRHLVDVKSVRESGHCCAFMLSNAKIQIAIFLDV